MRRRIEVTGPVDVDTAWERYALLANWPRWSPQIRAVDADEDRLTPGMHGLVRGPVGVVVPFHVEDVDAANRSWSWTATLLGVQVRMHHDLTPRASGGGGASGGSGTTAGLTMDGPAVVALTYGPVARIALQRLCRREI